jgi:hypothetical protein
MQNSFEALLRSMIYQIVSQDTESADVLLPLYLSHGSDALTRGNWSVNRLETAFAAILNTSTEIILWLDALDEFAGPPKFIAEFLENLVKPSPEASSSVRICFSSREWDEFERAFGRYANFQIHEQTRNAIISYASQRLKDAKLDNEISASNAAKRVKITPAASPSFEMASEIAKLAKGVFLWVKIVIDNLLELNRTPTIGDLGKLLSSTPENLEDLYKRAINRLPNDHRVEAFVMLELVSRVGAPDLELVVLAPAFAFCETAAECVDVIKRARSKEWFAKKPELKRRLRNRCGGLLEIISDHENSAPQATYQPSLNSSNWANHFGTDLFVDMVNQKASTAIVDTGISELLLGSPWKEEHLPELNRVQFMHQTVKDFVEDLAFEKHVFGPYHSPYYQNGHSFWMKYCFSMLLTLDGKTSFCKDWKYTRPERLVHHARLAESTTGRSQCDFLDSVPDELVDRKIFRAYSTDWFPINTVMALAVVADLRLYVQQKLAEKGSQIVNQNPEISLLHCAIWSARRFLTKTKVEDVSATSAFNLYDMVKLLLERGADINAKFRGLTPFEYLFYPGNPPQGEYRFSLDMIDIARVILEHGQNPNVPIIAGRAEEVHTFYPLDLAGGAMAKLLLAHKAVHFPVAWG